MTKDEVINEIRIVCKNINADAPLMLAIADVETGSKFNIDAKTSSGSYVGLYQLSNGKGGCSGADRNDISKATACAWKSIKSNKENFIKEFNYYEDWFSYGMHQQGLSGFKEIWRNRDKRFSDVSEARRNNMNNNVPSKMRGNMQGVSDFIDYWKERIDTLIKSYSNENNIQYAGIVDYNLFENYPALLYGGVILLGGLIITKIFIK